LLQLIDFKAKTERKKKINSNKLRTKKKTNNAKPLSKTNENSMKIYKKKKFYQI